YGGAAVSDEGAVRGRPCEEAGRDPEQRRPNAAHRTRCARARRRAARPEVHAGAALITTRPTFIALCVIAALALTGGVAVAHANYVKSNPASDARLAKSPAE